MPSNKIHVTTRSQVTHKQDWLGHFVGQANQKVTELQLALVTAVRQKFNVYDPWRSSSPGNYPKRIKSNLKKSIVVKDLNLRNVKGFEIATEGQYAGRVGRLQRGYTIQSKGNKPLAIPVSYAARMAAAEGKGPRQAFGNRIHRIFRKMRGHKVVLLVESVVHPASLNNRMNNHLKRNALGFKRYQNQADDVSGGATVHYVLKFGMSRIKPRKGLSDAIMESMPLIAKHLGGGWTNK